MRNDEVFCKAFFLKNNKEANVRAYHKVLYCCTILWLLASRNSNSPSLKYSQYLQMRIQNDLGPIVACVLVSIWPAVSRPVPFCYFLGFVIRLYLTCASFYLYYFALLLLLWFLQKQCQIDKYKLPTGYALYTLHAFTGDVDEGRWQRNFLRSWL